MNLTCAEPGDLPVIVELMNRSYRGGEGWAAETGYIKGDRVSLTDLQAELAENPNLQMLVWREGAALLGCVTLEPIADNVWYLGSLTVDPARQQAQAGRRLLEAAEETARAGGGRRMRLNVIWVREALIAWYRRRGYVPTGETKPFPYDDDRWGVPTRDDLYFVFFEKPL